MRTVQVVRGLTSGVVVLLGATVAGAQDARVLFLGNSYTARNGLTDLVEGLASASGRTIVVESHSPGGHTLGAPQASGQPHSSNPVSLGLITSQPWDVVVLQEQSFIPTIPSGKTDWMFTGATSLAGSITANHGATRVVLYQTWGRKIGGQFSWAGRPTPNFPDYAEMQDALTSAYGQCGSLVDGEVAPVGEAWRRSLNLRPTLELYHPDGSHPSLAGSYLAACVFHAQIFGESPVGITFTGGLSMSVASFLQQVAADVTPTGPASTRPPVRLEPASQNAADSADGAALAEFEGVLHAAWADAGAGDRERQDVLYARSADGGATWTAPLRLDTGDPSHAADSDEPRMVVTASGVLVVAFRERRAPQSLGAATADLYYNRSTDGGATWMPSALPLNTPSAGPSVVSDVHSHSVVASGESVHVVWEEDLIAGPGGADELTVTRSADAGATWSAPSILTPFVFPAPDADDPSLAADGDGVAVAFADRGPSVSGDVGLFRSSNDGLTWLTSVVESSPMGSIERPSAIRSGDDVVVLWLDDAGRGGSRFSLHAAASSNGGATFGPEVDLVPAIASTPGARVWSYDLVRAGDVVVVALAHDQQSLAQGGPGGEGRGRAFVVRSLDGGLTWGAAHELDASDPARFHAVPALAASGQRVALHVELKGANLDELGYALSIDAAATFGTIFQVSAPLGDVDTQPGPLGGAAAIVSDTGSIASLFWAPDLTGGGNELRVSGAQQAPRVGANACGPGAANSTGRPGTIEAFGSNLVVDDQLTVLASDLPSGTFGFFIASQTQSYLPQAGGSLGTLCISGAIGRFVGPGQVKNSGAVGAFDLSVGLNSLPTPTGLVPAAAGESWTFQAWHRDSLAGAVTSNFTSAVRVTFD